MEKAAQSAYLETQVRTATPQKLRLMLIERALRFANQTLQFWEQDATEQAFEALVRCREIVVELLTTVKVNETDVARQVAEIYAVLFRTLTEAQAMQDRQKMEKVVGILEIERETWRQVCERMPEAPDPALRQANAPEEITAAGMDAIPPRRARATGAAPITSLDATESGAAAPGGFSLDA